MAAPKGVWECPSCGDFVEDGREVCPRCGRKYHQSSTHPVEENPPKAEAEQFVLETTNVVGRSVAADFLQIFAWILWIGGLIVAIVVANVETGDYYRYTEFSWGVFLATYLTFVAAGALSMCASELFVNVARIADSLQRMTLTKK